MVESGEQESILFDTRKKPFGNRGLSERDSEPAKWDAT
jgi:hypothetical protein